MNKQIDRLLADLGEHSSDIGEIVITETRLRELLRGKVIVPEEPTEEMISQFFSVKNDGAAGVFEKRYKAMLQASEDQTNENT